jgi:hypothetical protein
MSIDVPVLEVLDLADRLRAAAEPGHDAVARLRHVGGTGDVAAAVEDVQDAFRLAARALAVEAEQLGRTVEGVALSWLALDADLLARRGHVLAR